MRTAPPMTSAASGPAKCAAIPAIQPGSAVQSASMKASTSPVASAAPRLRAGPGPGVASASSRTPKPAQIAAGGTVEPLSTTIVSTPTPSARCAASAARHARSASG